MLNVERVEAFARVLDGSPVTELVIEEGETCIRIVRSPFSAGPSAAPSEAEPDSPAPAEQWITAGRVGIFHYSTEPIRTGDRVEAGQVVGLIEAMRILNEVRSTFAGYVTEVMVEDGSPVEYGQELFLLKEAADEAGETSQEPE